LFYPKGKKGENIRQVPIIARMTITGYKVTQKHGEETRSNLIGPNIYKILSISCCVSSSNNFIWMSVVYLPLFNYFICLSSFWLKYI
jgi:hypothetical protein